MAITIETVAVISDNRRASSACGLPSTVRTSDQGARIDQSDQGQQQEPQRDHRWYAEQQRHPALPGVLAVAVAQDLGASLSCPAGQSPLSPARPGPPATARSRRTPGPTSGCLGLGVKVAIGYWLTAWPDSGKSIAVDLLGSRDHVGLVDQGGVHLVLRDLGQRGLDVLLQSVGLGCDLGGREHLLRRGSARHLRRADGDPLGLVGEVLQPGDLCRDCRWARRSAGCWTRS